MSDAETPKYFEDLPVLHELREQLVTHFARSESPQRHLVRHRRIGPRRPLIVLAVLVVGGASAAGAISLSGDLFPGEPPLPAKATVLSRGSSAANERYVLAVTPSKCPGWAQVEVRASLGYSAGGCGEPVNTRLAPRISGGFCGVQGGLFQGTVSARAKTIREIFRDAHSITTPVYAFPPNVHIKAGAFVITVRPGRGKPVTLVSLDSTGRPLASSPAPPMPHCLGTQPG